MKRERERKRENEKSEDGEGERDEEERKCGVYIPSAESRLVFIATETCRMG